MGIALFWHRRDLRNEDNAGLYHALKYAFKQHSSVQPLFIFDRTILDKLENNDFRMPFLHDTVCSLQKNYQDSGSDLWVFEGKPIDVFKELLAKHEIDAVFCNHDYEPEAIRRDESIEKLLKTKKVDFQTFKDQVIFEKSEVLTDQQKPYTVYTPYKKKWLANLEAFYLKSYPVKKYLKYLNPSGQGRKIPSLKDLGFTDPQIGYPSDQTSQKLIAHYGQTRDFPADENGTSHLGIHLRFGTRSVRELARKAKEIKAEVWLSELIWREFFMQILFHFPHVEKQSFRKEYDQIAWREDQSDFKKWCDGKTGYPLVDAGMRELNATGYMHNRVRMVVGSFLTKHLLIHWSWGERYFASKLLDYDLSANNGNWQWCAGSGCDAAPYFRVFNPQTQLEKFDPDMKYVKKWVPEIESPSYPEPMVEHSFARERALKAYALGLKK